MNENFYKNMGISDEVYAYASQTLEELKERFASIDELAEKNQMKVLAAMQKNQVYLSVLNYQVFNIVPICF